MKTVLITGASGFVGQRFCVNNKDRYSIKTVSLQKAQIEDLDFSGVDVILHLAGIAHRMEKTDDSLYFEVNYELTKKLAEAAKEAGVGHFIFVSTIKVYGDDYELLTPETACVGQMMPTARASSWLKRRLKIGKLEILEFLLFVHHSFMGRV